MLTRYLVASLVLSLSVIGACKKRPPILELSGDSAEDLEASKKFRELTPDYKELGLVKKGSDAATINIAILITCDEAAILPKSTDTQRSTSTGASLDPDTAVSTTTNTAPALAVDPPPYITLCPTTNVLNKSDYGDQAFLQIVEWLSGFRPGMNKKDLLAPPSDSEPQSSLLILDKISDLSSDATYRQISFSGRGPNLGPVANRSTTSTHYHVLVYLGFVGKSLENMLATAIAENDIILVNGHYYTSGEITRNEHLSSSMYNSAFQKLSTLAVDKNNRRPYRLVAFNGCYTESLETKLLNTFKEVSAKESTRIDVVGHRGINNYRFFAQQIAKLISNLHDGAAWIDILKGFNISTDPATTTVSGIIRNLFAINGIPNTVIPVLRNNRELIDSQTKKDILFDENGARLDD